MSRDNLSIHGGVREFWETSEQGGPVDVAAIIERHPFDALAIAREVLNRHDTYISRLHEISWLARSQVEASHCGRFAPGASIKVQRKARGWSPEALYAAAALPSDLWSPGALAALEAGDPDPVPVEAWAGLADVFEWEPYCVVAEIRFAFGERVGFRRPRGPRRLHTEPGVSDAAYLDEVRSALGVPLSSMPAIEDGAAEDYLAEIAEAARHARNRADIWEWDWGR